jgi:hypothetical protein
MSVITDVNYDSRGDEPWQKPVAKKDFLTAHDAVTNETTIVGTEKFVIKGTLKQLKYKAPNLTIDTEFNVLILDQDSAIVATISSIPDNAPTTPKYHRITEDSCPIFNCGVSEYFTINITWSTGQSILSNSFEIMGFVISE